MLSKLFAGMQHADQQTIAAMYGAPNGQAFAQWLRSLNFIRNVSAHHSRLWNINVLELSPRPSSWPTVLNTARPFFYFCLMQQLLGVICPNSNWGQRFKTLLADDFPVVANQQISQEELGAFPNWERWALWPQS
ncbi:Abi-like protein [compost metagenome]